MELLSRGVLIENLFGIDGLDIYWYGVLIMLGFLLAYLLCSHLAKKRGYPSGLVGDMLLIVILCAIVGARAYYVAFSWDHYFVAGDFGQTVKNVLAIRQGGLAIYGGVIAGILGLTVFGLVKKIHPVRLTDLCAAPLALGQAIGRWGNFANQEAHGALVTDAKLQFFPYAVYFDAPKDAPTPGWYQATFFYESVWCLLVVVLLLLLFRKQKYHGQLTLAYFALYGLERGIVEWLRTDQLTVLGLPVSALLSSVLCVVSVTLLVIFFLKKRREEMAFTSPPAAAEKTENGKDE